MTLSKGFWIGKYEVTQGQWNRAVGEFPGKFTAGEGDDFPVYTVNFAEAEGFCRKLTERAHASGELPMGWEFRLPTEAQWEYACRAGTTTATSFGDKLSSKQANFQGKPYNGAEPGPSLKQTARVGSYPANAWGLHDMHGNVFEWCRDWYHLNLPGGVDPDLYSAKSSAAKNRDGSLSRVRRGGCWADEGWPCRSAFRLRFEPSGGMSISVFALSPCDRKPLRTSLCLVNQLFRRKSVERILRESEQGRMEAEHGGSLKRTLRRRGSHRFRDCSHHRRGNL